MSRCFPLGAAAASTRLHWPAVTPLPNRRRHWLTVLLATVALSLGVLTPITPAVAGIGSTAICDRTLRQGDTGDCVRRLQQRLNNLGLNHGNRLVVDGRFGPNTRNRVEAFQGRNRLVVDGIVGPNTRGKIRNPDKRLGVISKDRVRQLIREIWPNHAQERAVRIANCESRHNPIAINRNANGTRDFGVFQFNNGGTLQAYLGTGRIGVQRALNARNNIIAARNLWRDRGFQPWVCNRYV